MDAFQTNWKLQKLPKSLRKTMPWTKKTIGLSVFCLMCQRSLKGSCTYKLKISWKTSYQIAVQHIIFRVLCWLQARKIKWIKYIILTSTWYLPREKCPCSEFFLSVFPSFGHSVSLRVQSKYEKIRTRKTPNTDIFYAVIKWKILPLGYHMLQNYIALL